MLTTTWRRNIIQVIICKPERDEEASSPPTARAERVHHRLRVHPGHGRMKTTSELPGE